MHHHHEQPPQPHVPADGVRALVFVADGSEDIETACITDVLVRAGVLVTLCSVMPSRRCTVTMARHLRVTADTSIDDVTDLSGYAAVVLPGGMPGAQTIGDHQQAQQLLAEMIRRPDGTIAAICAAPAVALGSLLHASGVPLATCFPAMRERLTSAGCVTVYVDEPVVAAKAASGCTVITSKGPATALRFAVALVERLVGSEKADAVARALLLH